MGFVTFYENADYNTNTAGYERTYEIQIEDPLEIVLLNSIINPVPVRSIKNTTSYFITLYYKRNDLDAFGNYIYIDKSSDIPNVTTENLFSPGFNGIVLQKELPDTNNEFNTYITNNESKRKPYDKVNVVIMTTEFTDNAENVPTVDKYERVAVETIPSSKSSIIYQQLQEQNEIKEKECKENQENRTLLINLLKQQHDYCKYYTKQSVVKNTEYEIEKGRLEKRIQALEKTNKALREQGSNTNTTNNKDSTYLYLYFVFIIDLFMLFYILYKHKDYFVGMK